MSVDVIIEGCAEFILTQLYHSDPLRDKKRALLTRICARDSLAIPIWRELAGHAQGLFYVLVLETLRAAIHTVELTHRAPKTRHELQESAKEATSLARRLAKLIRGSKNLESIELQDCFSGEFRAVRHWLNLDKKLYEALYEEENFRVNHPEFDDRDSSYAHRTSSYPMKYFWEALERFAQLAEQRSDWPSEPQPHRRGAQAHYLCKYLCINFFSLTGKPLCRLAAQLASIILEEAIDEDYVKKVWRRNRHEAMDVREFGQEARAVYLQCNHKWQGEFKRLEEILFTVYADWRAQDISLAFTQLAARIRSGESQGDILG
jgi:hypothetical protein